MGRPPKTLQRLNEELPIRETFLHSFASSLCSLLGCRRLVDFELDNDEQPKLSAGVYLEDNKETPVYIDVVHYYNRNRCKDVYNHFTEDKGIRVLQLTPEQIKSNSRIAIHTVDRFLTGYPEQLPSFVNCSVKEIDNSWADAYHAQNNIMGSGRTKYYIKSYGVFNNETGSLLSVLTLAESCVNNTNSNDEIGIERYSVGDYENFVYLGLFMERIIKDFKDSFNKIVSYCNLINELPDERLANGFILEKKTLPLNRKENGMSYFDAGSKKFVFLLKR